MKRKIIADLHNHSTASDGEFSPAGLVKRAKEIGLQAIALTDHDTIEGLDEVLLAGKQLNIDVIPGVEVSLAFKRSYFVGTLHVLLYFPESLITDTVFKDSLNSILYQGRGEALVRARIQAINEQFGPQGINPVLNHALTIEEILPYSQNITRRHFALALKEKHAIEDKQVISQIIGNDSPAYLPSGLNMDLLKPLFNEYSMLRILAHPAAGSFPGDSHYKEVLPPIGTVEKILPEFLALGIDGIEVYYPGHDEQHTQILLDWARKYDFIITGGSDCHDMNDRPLGVAGLTTKEYLVVSDKIKNL